MSKTRSIRALRVAVILPLLAPALLTSCAAKGGGSGTFSVAISPVVPTNQTPFSGLDDIAMAVVGADGSQTQYDLGTPASGLTMSGTSIPALADDALLFEGSSGGTIVSRGETAPLTASKGSATSSTVMFGSVDAVGWIGSLAAPVAGPMIVPIGGGNFDVIGGVGLTSGVWLRDYTSVQRISLSAPSEDLLPATVADAPTWTDLAGKTQQGWYGSSMVVIPLGADAGKVFIGGGGPSPGLVDSTAVTPGVWLYDPATATFDALGDVAGLASPRSEAPTVLDPQGGIVMWGGWAQYHDNGYVSINGTVEVWDPNTQRGSSVSSRDGGGNLDPSSVPMYDGAGASLGADGELFCGGGLLGTGGSIAEWTTSPTCNQVTAGHKITPADDLPAPLAGLAMITLQDGTILATGGSTETSPKQFDFSSTSPASAGAYLYDPAANAGRHWSAVGDMKVARAGHRMVLLPDGRVLVVGGSDTYGPDLILGSGLSCVEVYDPATQTFSDFTACDASSDTDGLAGRAVVPGIAIDPDYGVVIAGGTIDYGTAQDAINVVMFGG